MFALMAATDPIRIGIAMLLISRERPIVSLFAFWLGGMVTGIAVALAVLMVLRNVAPVLADSLAVSAGGSAARDVQVVVGGVAVMVAVAIAAGVGSGRRKCAPAGGDAAGGVPPRNVVARASARAVVALEGGSPVVAFVVGLGSATPPVECIVVLAAIMASGAALGAQIAAAIVFTVLAFAIVEIPLVSFLVAPGATQAVLLRIHQWLKARRRMVLAVLAAVGGLYLMSTGM